MNLQDQVTEHFKVKEFLWSQHCHRHAAFSTHPRIREAQEAIITHLGEQLEVIRGWYNKPIKVKSGMRDLAIHQQLLADGIRSSSVTDHSYMHPDVWAWGSGAVDIEVSMTPHTTVMQDLMHRQDLVAFDYAILYTWGLHIAAPKDLLLNVAPDRSRFMESVGGGNYRAYGGTA